MENEGQKRSRISVINEDILSDKNLNPAEKMVYARICYFEEFFESAAATAEYLGLREWTVQSAKRKLERLGYIKCVKNTGRGKRYVADVNSGIVTDKGRVCPEQDQTLLQTKSDLAVNNIRPCKYQDIGKKENKNEEENVDKIYTIKADRKKSTHFQKPTIEEVKSYCLERKNQINPESFIDFYESKGWLVGKSPMKDWRAAIRTWERNGYGQLDRRAVTPAIYEQNVDAGQYQPIFDLWKKYLGVSVKPTQQQVAACKELVEDIGEEWVEKLIVALRMRSQTNYVTRDIKAIKDFVGLAEERTIMMSFYDENWKKWKRLQELERTGRKPWQL